MPARLVTEPVLPYLQLACRRVAIHIIRIGVEKGIFPDAGHAQGDSDVVYLMALGECRFTNPGYTFLEDEGLNLIPVLMPGRIIHPTVVAHLTATGCGTNGECGALQTADSRTARPFHRGLLLSDVDILLAHRQAILAIGGCQNLSVGHYH